MKLNNPTVIERNVKCPFCGDEHAMLINKEDGMKTGIGLPAYGLKSLLRFMYLNIVHIAISGFRLFQITRKKAISTYIFCPACGNAASANAPEEIKQEAEEPKLYRIKTNKAVTGLSKGIAEYTGLPVLWVRICNILYAAMGIYFLIAICIPYKEDVEAGIVEHRKFAKAREGKWIFGICKGISNYTDIPVGWIRLFACIFAMYFIPVIVYIIAAVRVPFQEDVESGAAEHREFAKAKSGKWIFGICKGISNYSGIPVAWVRVLTCICGLAIGPAIAYIVAGLVIKKVGD